MTRRHLWIWLTVAACGAPSEIPKEDFAQSSAGVLCRRTRECSRGQFEASYFGMSDCVAHYVVQLQQFVDLADSFDCEYDAAEAAAAYVEVTEMSCEDFFEGDYLTATADVWPECGLVPTTSYPSYYGY